MSRSVQPFSWTFYIFQPSGSVKVLEEKKATWLSELGVNMILVDLGKLRINVVDNTAGLDFWGKAELG